jgi:UDP-N-acetylmuramate--alanine ligase
MSASYHFIGIGGIGMSALASILLQKGAKVTGSDEKDSFIVDKLRKEGAQVFIGHNANHVQPGAVVVYSSGIQKENPELLRASSLHNRLIHRSVLLNELAADKQFIGIVGTHGKTTTTSLLIHVYQKLGKDPSFAVGGILNESEKNGYLGEGSDFIAELDESDGSFLSATPHAVCVTNIDSEHLEYYGDEHLLEKAFEKFLVKVRSQEKIVWCKDNPTLKNLHPKGLSFGFGEDSQVRARNYEQQGAFLHIDVNCAGVELKNVRVPLLGKHNALNVLAVIGQCWLQGLDLEEVKKTLVSFQGVKRRAELLLSSDNFLVFNDYAHHPTEIDATLKAFKAAYPQKRLFAVLQPHRAARVSRCSGMWGSCFQAADLVYVTDVFRLRNETEQVDTQQIIKECRDCNQMQVEYVAAKQLISQLIIACQKEDLILFMGAGDITQTAKEFCQEWQKQSDHKS